MENFRTVLQESDPVNMSDWTAVNGMNGSYFTDRYPARATVQTAGLPKGALVEIQIVA